MSEPTHCRYISRARLPRLSGRAFEQYRPDAADGESIGRTYDIQTDAVTDWIVVANDDARAETVDRLPVAGEDRPPHQTIAARLARAQAAHQRYRDALPQRAVGDPTGPILPGDPIAAHAALQDAYDARTAAIADDPEQHDPAWQAEAVTVYDHHALLTFYREQLGRVH